MVKELIYRLSNPGYTIYHRAALGGLAATLRAWGANKPEGIEADMQRDFVRLAWSDDLSDQEAMRRILASSFKLTEDKMIELPGQGIRVDQADLRLAIHNGIMGTFLDHNSAYDAEGVQRIELKSVDDEVGSYFTYKGLSSYAHQEALTRLKLTSAKGELLTKASIPKWLVPGAFTGANALEATTDESLMMLFLLVGCPIFLLRPRTYKEKAQYCVIVPDVIDLKAYSRALQFIATSVTAIERFSGSYRGRVVGGVEEAALRFLIDLHAGDIASERSVTGCLAVAMGKVSWDPKQNNRSFIVKIKNSYPEIGVFHEAYRHFAKAKIIRSKKGEGYAIPKSPVPELVAANLVAELHWCANFKSLVSDKKDFARMNFSHGGLKAMKEAIKDADDQAIIRAFHQAWKRTMAALGDRARRDGLNFGRLLEVERERTRNAILRTKTAEALASWFLRFCADATKGGSLRAIQDNQIQIQKFIFNQRNFDRFQNLCLFALVSYASDESNSENGGKQ
jgi:CRISPR-associated protein Cas8a1/Csx13